MAVLLHTDLFGLGWIYDFKPAPRFRKLILAPEERLHAYYGHPYKKLSLQLTYDTGKNEIEVASLRLKGSKKTRQ